MGMNRNGINSGLHPLQITIALTFLIKFASFYILYLPLLTKTPLYLIGISYSSSICLLVTTWVLIVPSNPTDTLNINYKWCLICLIPASKSTYHCSQCNRCTYGFDHHCKWVNNCIGKSNYSYFVGLSVSIILNTGIYFSGGIILITGIIEGGDCL